ncbi:hypothetical protein PLICRDRAFT_113446 [Plicaturopsis crispa FD-325 SS-3]|nr:hypothetical protein PLICRDRAFT_113446 [Plicaturopsis crispa FD-325 SS-3]
MFRSIVLFVVASFACAFMVSASPVPSNATLSTLLDKRTTHSGRGTWFDVGLGNCGYTDQNSDPILAISTDIYGSGGNCNQWVHITNLANGKSAWGKTRDSCPSCGSGDLDMSPSLFQQLGSLDTGVLSISWHFENKNFSP